MSIFDKKTDLNPIKGGGQKRLRASFLLNFDKNNHHMVKCHENAYYPKNLSLFVFNIEGC